MCHHNGSHLINCQNGKIHKRFSNIFKPSVHIDYDCPSQQRWFSLRHSIFHFINIAIAIAIALAQSRRIISAIVIHGSNDHYLFCQFYPCDALRFREYSQANTFGYSFSQSFLLFSASFFFNYYWINNNTRTPGSLFQQKAVQRGRWLTGIKYRYLKSPARWYSFAFGSSFSFVPLLLFLIVLLLVLVGAYTHRAVDKHRIFSRQINMIALTKKVLVENKEKPHTQNGISFYFNERMIQFGILCVL